MAEKTSCSNWVRKIARVVLIVGIGAVLVAMAWELVRTATEWQRAGEVSWQDVGRLAIAVLSLEAADFRVVLRGMLGSRLGGAPFVACWSSAADVGVKRSAVLGTSSTSMCCVAVMVAVAVMPGRRLRSALSTSR